MSEDAPVTEFAGCQVGILPRECRQRASPRAVRAAWSGRERSRSGSDPVLRHSSHRSGAVDGRRRAVGVCKEAWCSDRDEAECSEQNGAGQQDQRVSKATHFRSPFPVLCCEDSIQSAGRITSGGARAGPAEPGARPDARPLLRHPRMRHTSSSVGCCIAFAIGFSIAVLPISKGSATSGVTAVKATVTSRMGGAAHAAEWSCFPQGRDRRPTPLISLQPASVYRRDGCSTGALALLRWGDRIASISARCAMHAQSTASGRVRGGPKPNAGYCAPHTAQRRAS